MEDVSLTKINPNDGVTVSWYNIGSGKGHPVCPEPVPEHGGDQSERQLLY